MMSQLGILSFKLRGLTSGCLRCTSESYLFFKNGVFVNPNNLQKSHGLNLQLPRETLKFDPER